MKKMDGFEYDERHLGGVTFETAERGAGRPILFLPSLQGIWSAAPFLEGLSRQGRLIVPTHPGFGYADMPRQISAVDDYVYLYLDLLDKLDLQDVLLIGSSLGGWMASEIAVRNQHRLSGLVLIDTLGFKFSGREERDVVDMHGVSTVDLAPLFYSDPEKFRARYAEFDDEEVLRAARAWESFTYIGWQPYMHNPKLAGRLHRITIPTLVLWGADDGIVLPDHGRHLAGLLPNATFETVAGAAHFPYIEQPCDTLDRIKMFSSAIPTV